MNRNHAIHRLTRIVAIAATLAVAAPAVAADSVRVYVVKEKKDKIAAPGSRDAGFISRALAKRFGVKAPKSKSSVVQIDLPASVWEATKVDVARIVASRNLSAVVVDSDPLLGAGWAAGLSIEERDLLASSQIADVEVSLAGTSVKKLARQVLVDQMNDRVDQARRRNQRGGLQGKPSEEKEGLVAPGSFDIDYGPDGPPIEIDCEDARNSDELACQLSPNDGDTDPEPNDDERGGDADDLPSDPRDCDPFVDADCGGSDPCSLGLGENHPLAEALGCGFLDAVEDGAIGPRTTEDEWIEVGYDTILWGEDTACGAMSEDTDVCIGSGSLVYDDPEGLVCESTCEEIQCSLTQEEDEEVRDCTAKNCAKPVCS